MPVETSYVAELRRRIQDVRHSRRAFTVGVTDDNVTRCIAEVTNGRLILTPQGGTAPRLDIRLTDSRFDTIGALHQVISRTPGYTAQLDEDANLNHVSIDLEPIGPIDIKGTGVELRHRMFGDGELNDLVTRALQRHNPSMTLSTMPPQEWTFVLSLAHAEVCRVQAYDASKRKGLDTDVDQLLRLAESFEQQYKDDTQRNARAIQSPKEANSNLVDEGDVMLGQQYRVSLRTGRTAPQAKTLPPSAAVLNDLSERDAEDDNIRIVWQRNKDTESYGYELWMDTQPEVVRGGTDYFDGGRAPNWMADQGGIDPQYEHQGRPRETTSHRVFSSFTGNSNAGRMRYSTYLEEIGQLIRAYSVGNLESETTYYFRLFVAGVSGPTVGSNVISATTKPLRARFAYPIYRDKEFGFAGDVVTVSFDPAKGQFTEKHIFKIGEKIVTPTIIDPFTIRFVVPAFEHRGSKDFAVISPTKLVDVRRNAFTVRP